MFKKEFPFLRKNQYIYLDSAGTTLKHKNVLKKMKEYYYDYNSNIHTMNNRISELATIEYENTRYLISKLLNCRKDEIIFTFNSTDSLNLLANSNLLTTENEVLISETEHFSNFLPWLRFKTKLVKVDEYGLIDVHDLKNKISKHTKIFAFTAVSNVTGNIQKLEEIIKICKNKNILTVCDMTQYIPHEPVDLYKYDLDFVSFSGHKMFAATGIGILFGKYEHLENLLPNNKRGGGTIIDINNALDIKLKAIPYCFEAGTPSIEAVIGLGEAVKFLLEKVYPNKKYLKKLENLFSRELRKRNYVESLFLLSENRIPLFTLSFKSKNYDDKLKIISEILSDTYNIFVNVGFQCSQFLYNSKSKKQSMRISLHIYNSEKDILDFFDALDSISIIFSEKGEQ